MSSPVPQQTNNSQEKDKDKEKSQIPSEPFIIRVSDGVVILGHRGAGKSNLIRWLVKEALKDYNFVVLDVVGSLRALKNLPNVEYYTVNPRRTEQVNQIITKLLNDKNKMLVSDEIDRFNYIKTSALNDLVNIGRNMFVGYLVAARRTASVSKDFLSNAEWTFVFKHILPQDLEVLFEWFNIDEPSIRNLEDYEFILFHGAEPVWKGKVPFVPSNGEGGEITPQPYVPPKTKPTPPEEFNPPPGESASV